MIPDLAQPAIRDTPAIPSKPDLAAAARQRIGLALLDAVGPVQARIAGHAQQAAGRQVDVGALLAPAELHHDGAAQRQRVQLVVGGVGVDVGRDPGPRRVPLQTDLVGGPALRRRDQRGQPPRERLVGDVRVHAEGLVVECVAVVQRQARGRRGAALGPGELVLEDVQELLLVLGRDEVLL